MLNSVSYIHFHLCVCVCRLYVKMSSSTEGLIAIDDNNYLSPVLSTHTHICTCSHVCTHTHTKCKDVLTSTRVTHAARVFEGRNSAYKVTLYKNNFFSLMVRL